MEELSEHPVVQTDCGHFFHGRCLRARVDAGAQHNIVGDPVLFDFLECPLCRRPGLERLSTVRRLPPLKRQLELRSMVSAQRDSLCRGGDIERKFVFQVCQRCTLPYCSGADECHAQVRGELEAICSPCSEERPAGRPRVCPLHGSESIVWKCRYCCSVATFECFSGQQQLHVCGTCHELVELGHLFDFDKMANASPLSEYGTCPVRRNVYWERGSRWKRMHLDEGKPMDASQLKAVEHRRSAVVEKLARCEQELRELSELQQLPGTAQDQGAALRRLQGQAHSLRVEKQDLEARARAWSTGGEALVCPLGGLHPPAGVEYCLGCTLCDGVDSGSGDVVEPVAEAEEAEAELAAAGG